MEKHIALNPPGKSSSDEASSEVKGVADGVQPPAVKPDLMKRRNTHEGHTERIDDPHQKRSKADAEPNAKDTDGKPTDTKITNMDVAPVASETSAPTFGWTDEQNVFVYDLSDEVLLNILKYLDSASLENFGETCQRFQILSQDTFLWVDFDFRRRPLSASQLANRLKHVHGKTLTFRVAGLRSLYPATRYKDVTLTLPILEKLVDKCPKLREITVTDAMLDIDACPITRFPDTLSSLTLKNCDTQSPSRMFIHRGNAPMIQLRELRIEYCNFFETNQIIAISKMPNLKVLSLRGCRTVRDCVQYCGVATKFGFHQLEHLDLRDTPITDHELHFFNDVKTLRTIMLEFPKFHYTVAESGSTSSMVSAPTSLSRPIRARNVCHRNVAQGISVVLHGNDQNAHAQPEVPVIGPLMQQERIMVVRNIADPDNAVPGAPPHYRIHFENVPYGFVNQYRMDRPRVPFINDRGICSFGVTYEQTRMVLIPAEPRMAETALENVVVRGYSGVTDVSLRHLAQCAPNLRRIDVTGTAVTAAGLVEFRSAKPACVVLHSLNDVAQPVPDESQPTAE